MKCKYCQAELEEGASVCPNCGEVQENHTPAAQDKSKPLVLVLGALLLVAVVALIVVTLNKGSVPAPTDPVETPAASQTVEATVETQPPMKAEDFLMYPQLTDRLSYNADDAAFAQALDKTVATAGEFTMDNRLLQAYYWAQVNEFDSQNSGYTYYMYGLDVTAPMDTQKISGVDVTWEQYFLDSGLALWYQCAMLNTLAKEADYVLDAELQTILDGMLADLDASAAEYGYENADALVAEAMGPGCTAQSYYDYMVFYMTAMYYSLEMVDGFRPTAEEVKAHYDANLADFVAAGITEQSAPFVDVRHILIMPEGGQAATEDAWAAAYAEAEAILNGWKAAEATEDAFAALANEHSEDGGSNTTGGLYEDVTDDGTYVPEFTNWAIDPERKVGDTGIVRTDYGYHIMYCSDIAEAWYRSALEDLLNRLYAEKMEACQTRCPLEIHVDAITLGRFPEPAPEETAPATTAPVA